MMEYKKRDALVVVDIQNDFSHPGGSLYVKDAQEIIPRVNELLGEAVANGVSIYYSKDWHPKYHVSFDTWPEHCVQNTWGAELDKKLVRAKKASVVLKGQHPEKDEYSAFATGSLREWLTQAEITRLYVCGLATDYCVKATVLDGLDNGFEVIVVSNGVAGVNVNPGDVRRAFEEMEEAGAVIL